LFRRPSGYASRRIVTAVVERPARRKGRVEKPGKGGQPKRRLRGEAVAEVAGQRQAPTVRASHLEVLQETLDQMVADYRYCQKKVNDLPEADIWRETMLGGKIPNEWIRLRDEYGRNLQHVAIKLTQAG